MPPEQVSIQEISSLLNHLADLLEAKGYKMGDSVVAIRVELPTTKKVLKLRDDNGWPLWMGGPRQGGGGPR